MKKRQKKRMPLISGISRLFYRSAARPAGALLFACLVTGYSLAFILPLTFLPHNHAMKIVYTVCSWFPLPLTWWFLLRGFIWPIFNNKKNDDLHASVFSYLLAISAKIVSMASIYMIMYIWEPKTFEILSVDSRLNAWGMFVAMSSYITSGTAPVSTFDTTAPLSALIVALDLFMSYAMNFIVFVTIVVNALKKITNASVYVKNDGEDE